MHKRYSYMIGHDVTYTYGCLDHVTLYPSPYMVLTEQGYTKHYNAGTDLCASREQSQACLSYAEMEQRRRSQRRLKLTGENKQQDVNADLMATYTVLNEPTLYPSSYMVLNNKGYTKHYYAGTDLCASREQSQACLSYAETKQSVRSNRVAARLGGGGLNAQQHVVAIDDDLQWKADRLFKQSLDQVNHRVLGENDLECIMHNEFSTEVFGRWIEGIPCHVRAEVAVDNGQFKEMVNSMLDDPNHGKEKDVYFYHSDHLGSASWITDYRGMAVQHIPSVSNSRGTYRKERYEFNPLKLKAKDSLLKDL